MAERIEVRVRPVRGSWEKGGHVFIVYHPDNGPPRAISLAPKEGTWGMFYGTSQLKGGEWGKGHYDWPRDGETASQLVETIEDVDLSSEWKAIVQSYRYIADRNNYWTGSTNSNAAGSKALAAAGIRVNWNDSRYWLPGLDEYRYNLSRGSDGIHVQAPSTSVSPFDPVNLLQGGISSLTNSGPPQTFQRDYQPYFPPGQLKPGPTGLPASPQNFAPADPTHQLYGGVVTAPDRAAPQGFRLDYQPYLPPNQFQPGFANAPGSQSDHRPNQPPNMLRGGTDFAPILRMPAGIRTDLGLGVPSERSEPAPASSTEFGIPAGLLANLAGLNASSPRAPRTMPGPLPGAPASFGRDPGSTQFYRTIANAMNAGVPATWSNLALGLVPGGFAGNGTDPAGPDELGRFLFPYGVSP